MRRPSTEKGATMDTATPFLGQMHQPTQRVER